MAPYDVITTGRIGVDLYPEESGRTLAEARRFTKSLGGSATNVAVAAARLGCSTAVVTKVGEDKFGEYLLDELAGYGVDRRWVGVDPKLRTPIVFCEIFPPDNFPLLFYREPSAPDLQLGPGDFDLDAVKAARVFWTTATGLSAEPSRGALLEALRARAAEPGSKGGETIHDLDYRPMFWGSRDEAGRLNREALACATIAVGNQDEVEVATGLREPRAAAEALLELGPRLAIVKCGPDGVYALGEKGEELEIEPFRLEVVNGLGAGDSFGGALCAGLVRDWGLERTLRAANAAGALVASRHACAPDMPTQAELEEFVGELARA